MGGSVSRREDIDTAVWSDPDFLDLTPHAKLVYVWSFTNPRCGMAGIYKVVRPAVVMETGLTDKQAEQALTELGAGRFVFFDGRVMWVRSRIKHLRSRGTNIATAIRRDLESVGPHEFRDGLVEAYLTVDWLKGVLEGVGKTLPRDPQGPSRPLTPSEGLQGKGREGQLLEGPSSATPSTHDAADATPPARIEDAQKRVQSIDRIWTAYVETRTAVLGARSVPKLTPDRRALITRRRKDWSEPDLVDAVKGWRHFPHNRGENVARTPYCDIELVLRDAAHIEKFRDAERAGTTGNEKTDDVVRRKLLGNDQGGDAA